MQEDGSFNPLITMYKMSFILINSWIFLQVAAPQLEGRGENRLGGWTFECALWGARRGAVIGAGHGGGPHRLLRERVQGGRKSGGRLAAGERAGQPAGARQITQSTILEACPPIDLAQGASGPVGCQRFFLYFSARPKSHQVLVTSVTM